MSQKQQPKKSSKGSSHEERVSFLSGKLLSTLAEHRLPNESENLKGLGWFLLSIGESVAKGSQVQAKLVWSRAKAGENIKAENLGIALCLKGYELMDWAAGLYHQEKGKK